MWMIYEKKHIQKTLRKVPREILGRYEAWKRIVELEGTDGLKLIKGFHDEILKEKWEGFRSSRLNLKWRIIYKVEQNHFEVYVFEITPHKY